MEESSFYIYSLQIGKRSGLNTLYLIGSDKKPFVITPPLLLQFYLRKFGLR